ncbi:S-layer homology domain-containing protein [Paenibacillus eucommiae]|uniref:SLH domain-containing protein n=1 Tax=Paenibacillus eucommiae TaxID=1355755 RepID=A0ABS4J1L8_9BACL|nr:S-layer homology domain-containing protein [Paenibacillus eucommiae]MBP1993026.1 hypothetical protein [Paenibacillus eucommiae]
MRSVLISILALLFIGVNLTGTYVHANPDNGDTVTLDQSGISSPYGLAYYDGEVYVAQRDKGISKFTLATGAVTQIVASNQSFMSIAVNQEGDLFYTVDSSNKINKIPRSALSGQLPLTANELAAISTVYHQASFNYVYGLAFNSAGDLYFAGYNSNGIFVLPKDSSTSTQLLADITPAANFYAIAFDNAGNLYLNNINGNFYKISYEAFSAPLTSSSMVNTGKRGEVYGLTFLPDGRSYTGNAGVITEISFQSPPVITLNGPAVINIGFGEEYEEAGVTIVDEKHENLIAQITYSKDGLQVDRVNTGVAGTYKVHYNVTNPLGLKAAEVKRTVIVESPIAVTGITLDQKTLNLEANGTSSTLNAEVLPANAANKTIIWESSDPNIATVTDGIVRPVSAGTTTITASTVDGDFTDTAVVTVTSVPSPAPTSVGEKITLAVKDSTGQNLSNATATLTRTSGANGQKKDEVTFSQGNALETISSLQAAKQTIARLILPDTKDEVEQVKVSFTHSAAKLLAEANISIEIHMNDVIVSIPAASLTNYTEDVYFHIVPIKEKSAQNEVEDRAKQEKIVTKAIGRGTISIVGRPMTIETNLQSRAVELVLPLDPQIVPQDAAARKQWLSRLSIFVEHSDGEKELIQPQVVNFQEGKLGLKFTVTKFSTFTIVDLPQQEVEVPNKPSILYKGYMQGYLDGTFRPDHTMSRAEMAMILSRLEAGTSTPASAAAPYSDVPSSHWALQAILYTQTAGLMDGVSGNVFAPGQAITRAEMAAISSRWLNLTGEGQSQASDISGHWASAYIKQASQAGIMTDLQDGTFKPNQPLTRAEAAAIINRILKRDVKQAPVTTSFTDVPSTHWAFSDIIAASTDFTSK